MSAETSPPLARTNPPRSPSAIAWKLTLVLIPLLVAAGLFVLREAEVARLAHHRLPRLGVVPLFQLTDQNNQPFSSSQLRGKIWLADFIYTTCPGPCAMISTRLSETQKPLRDTGVKIVTFTVDPAHDTPAVLRRYAGLLHAQPGRWEFLTGDKSTIDRLAREGFKLAAGTAADGQPIHSTRIVLIDRAGTIRAYYEATDADAITRLLADVTHLRQEEPE